MQPPSSGTSSGNAASADGGWASKSVKLRSLEPNNVQRLSRGFLAARHSACSLTLRCHLVVSGVGVSSSLLVADFELIKSQQIPVSNFGSIFRSTLFFSSHVALASSTAKKFQSCDTRLCGHRMLNLTLRFSCGVHNNIVSVTFGYLYSRHFFLGDFEIASGVPNPGSAISFAPTSSISLLPPSPRSGA